MGRPIFRGMRHGLTAAPVIVWATRENPCFGFAGSQLSPLRHERRCRRRAVAQPGYDPGARAL